MVSRRRFNQYMMATAFSGLAKNLFAGSAGVPDTLSGYGSLQVDPNAMLDLPAGFSYRVISSLGDAMDDGLAVPDRADGMGCLALDEQRVVLVRNHELAPQHATPGALASVDKTRVYDTDADSMPLPGGTSHVIYNLKQQRVERQFMSLLGTVRNCAGGVTPWGSWLTCEESVLGVTDNNHKAHGYVFEVPATATELVQAMPIKAMGRFNHEAACVDPRTGIVYMTEDRNDSLLYRFIPLQPGNLMAGGKLQALCITSQPKYDTRNWQQTRMQKGESLPVSWVDLTDTDSPQDDLRLRGYQQGAALFARGEGVHWGENELYFCCTSGGPQKLGQVMRYVPSALEGEPGEKQQPGTLSLLVESDNPQTFNFGDNIAVAPDGHMLVCEDQYTDVVQNHLRGITPDGDIYTFARVRWQTEPAGVCFSPDGRILFVNLYSPTATLAISGPWHWLTA